MACNTAWHESTGATPAYLFFGRELEDPLSLKWELYDQDFQQRPDESSRYWKRALKQLKSARDRAANRYDMGTKDMNFKVGDLVLCKSHALSSEAKKYSAKHSNKWSSPSLIARFLTGVTVQLANPETGLIVKKAHVSHLKRYFPAE
jgi:hypothetical protein